MRERVNLASRGGGILIQGFHSLTRNPKKTFFMLHRAATDTVRITNIEPALAKNRYSRIRL
jgi:hypothetical protein